MNWLNPKSPLIPERHDMDAPDYWLDHRDEWGGFASQFDGCSLAQEEAIRDLEGITGQETPESFRLHPDDFDKALIEGEAWEN